MPTISKIRLTNIIYENGAKRYHDEIFRFDGNNGIFLLENGGGKTVFLQTVLQAILPHMDMAERKIKDTLSLDSSPAHIAIEWIMNEQPRRYALTAVTLFLENNELKSLKYAFDYGASEKESLENLPFVVTDAKGRKRAADKGEVSDYYSRMKQQYMNAKTFATQKEFWAYLEENFQIIPNEWRKIAVINGSEGGVEAFFDHCRTTEQLVNNLLIPTVEDALQGSEKTSFVETFEKQREHYKLNRILLEEIEEFKNIKGKVDEYVQEYAHLHEAKMNYESEREGAKAFFLYIASELEKQETEVESWQKEQQTYEEVQYRNHHKKASIKVRELEREIEEKDKLRVLSKKDFEEANQSFLWKDQQIQNLEISEYQEELKVVEQQLHLAEEELKEIEKTPEEEELREEKEKTESQLAGYFREQISQIQKKKEIIGFQIAREKKEKNQKQEEVDQKQKQADEKKSAYEKADTLMNANRSRMKELLDKLYDDVSEENILEKNEQWAKKLRNLEDMERSHELRRREISIRKEERNVRVMEYQEQSRKMTGELSASQAKLREIEVQQEKVITTTEDYYPNFSIYDGIYEKEASLKNLLSDRIRLNEKELEEALLQERVSGRMADFYQDSPYFTADPFVHRKLRQIGNQVDYLQHGVEYVSQRLEEGSLSKEVLYENYPYWAQTLITTEKSKKKVEEYFSAFTKELSHPLYILNTQEIKEILESGSRKIEEESCVYPDSWENNLDQSVFISWQKEMAEQAQEAKSERNSIQLKLDGVKKLSHFVWEYYDTYPLEDYRQIQEKIRKLSEELRSINERLIIEEEARQKLEQEEKNIADFFRSSAEEKPMLGKKLEQVKEYQNVQKAMLQQQAMSREMKTEFDQLLSSLHRLKKQIGEVEGRIKESEEASRECSEEIRHIQSSELYERVYQKEATYSEMAFEVMKERLRNLEDQLAGFSRKAKDVENRIRDFQKREQKLRKDIDWCHKKAKYPIEPKELMSDEAKENLLKAWKSEEEEVDSLRKQLAVVEKEKEKLLVEKRIFMEEVIEKYQIVFEFTNDLHLEKAKIEEEMKELRKVKKNLEERRAELDKRLALLSETGNKLRIEDAKHDFVSLAIDTFDPNNYLSFSYEPAPFMNKVSKGLEEKKEKLESRNQVIQKEKERYIDYCSRNIHEYKLKDMAVKGVEKNTNYNDLLDFKRRMEEILNRNIKVAEDDRRESDEELQVFIVHLLTYAKNVLMEIDGIQKKTKIQVEEETKQIFLFDIPTWEELTAKEQLRKYIDRTVSDYDQEAQLKGEDKEALHQFIEQRLSVKNLILCVLGDRSIKIKCRKVTNDLKINQAPMSWESSNKWSGGEKWSKNMTLFLSILNYLAEKKQFSVKHLKKHRTVILDNPFGKASSQHVLDPVFFVADHLGFQIITVTAHAEGKFVTDYFPVVYSGKLRESMDADKQIMELSRSLNTAYLHTNSPDSMSNLEEAEQMSLL